MDVGSRSSDTERTNSIKEIFEVCRDVPAVSSGLLVFLRTTLRRSDIVKGPKEKKAVRSGCRQAEKALTILATDAEQGTMTLDD